MNWRRVRKWTLIFVGLAAICLLGGAWFVGGTLVAPAHRVVGPPPDDFPADSVSFSSRSRAQLAGWYLQVADSKATAILLHPIRGDRRVMLTRAQLFRSHGYSTLLIDLQAHGESHGQRITVGHLERHDVDAAIGFILEQDPKQKVVVVGRSLGGAATLFAQPDVEAIVLESVYPTVSEAVHNRVEMRLGWLHHALTPLLLVQLKSRLGIGPHELRPIDQLAGVNAPILIASGDVDQHTTVSETERMYRAANEPKRLVIFEGAGHVDLLAYDPQKYENEIIGFVNETIGPRTSDVERK